MKMLLKPANLVRRCVTRSAVFNRDLVLCCSLMVDMAVQGMERYSFRQYMTAFGLELESAVKMQSI